MSSRSTDASCRVASCVSLPYCYAHVGTEGVLYAARAQSSAHLATDDVANLQRLLQ